MLKQFGKTPADLGLAWSEVDPAWQDAMLIIDGSRAKQAADDQNRRS